MGAVLALAERLERVAEVVLGRGPLQRDALARSDLQGGAIGADRLFEPLGAVLALAERRERGAEVVLGHRPFERDALARLDLQGGAIVADRLFKRLVLAGLLTDRLSCQTEREPQVRLLFLIEIRRRVCEELFELGPDGVSKATRYVPACSVAGRDLRERHGLELSAEVSSEILG